MALEKVATAQRSDGTPTLFTVYEPAAESAAAPLALLSPGAAGHHSHLAYLARALANAGWLAIVMGHRESGRDALHDFRLSHGSGRDALLALTCSHDAHSGRRLDIDAVLDWVRARYQPSTLALLGHSMGAAMTMIEAGALNQLGVAGSDRFDAYVVLSPQGPGSIFPERAWSGIRKPLLIVTGTRDNALEGDWQWRTRPFAELPAGRKWLAIIRGATHLSFAGLGFRFRVRRLTARVVVAFLESVRHGREETSPVGLGLSLQRK